MALLAQGLDNQFSKLDPLVLAVIVVISGTVYGLLLIGVGQVFSALREIALNTRAAVSKHASGSGYIGLRFIGAVLVLCGFLIILFSLLLAALVSQTR